VRAFFGRLDMERFVDHILCAGFHTLAAVCELSAGQLHQDHGVPKLLAGDDDAFFLLMHYYY
jgi:hypothetical protein